MKVSAVIVTRGDVSLDPILEVLAQVPRIDEVVVWDNSVRRQDVKTWGRHAVVFEARHPIIYSQDDDLVHTPEAIGRILDAYQPGVITGCMWPEWSAAAERQGIDGGYHDLVFPGSGSVYDREVCRDAAKNYRTHFPYDEFFRMWCDAIIGVLAPTVQLDERFQTLPAAHLPDRLSRLDKGGTEKREAIMRARAIRYGGPKRHAHSVYMEELEERLRRCP